MKLLIARNLSTIDVNVHTIQDNDEYDSSKYMELLVSDNSELISICYDVLVKDYTLLEMMSSFCMVSGEGSTGRYLLYLPKENNVGAEPLIVDSIVGDFRDKRYTEFCSSKHKVNIMKCYGLLSTGGTDLIKRAELFKQALITRSVEVARKLRSVIDVDTIMSKQAFNILATEYTKDGKREVIVVQDYIRVDGNGVIHNVPVEVPGYRRLDYRDNLVDALELKEELDNNKEELDSYFYI